MKRYLCIVGVLLAATSLFAAVRVDTTPASTTTTDEVASNGDHSVTFRFIDVKAKSVHVAGEFNHWRDNVDGRVNGKDEWLMQNGGAGNWTFATTLPPGRHEFKYVIDGGDHWAQDPSVPSLPAGNSILEMKGSAVATPASGGTTLTFTFADAKAKAVFVAGPFNNWNPTTTPMKKNDAGIWSATVALSPDKQPYKFFVDGAWQLDPKDPVSEADGAGNVNSIKTVAR
jgi:1,4-alpha-glucan branching enzyme